MSVFTFSRHFSELSRTEHNLVHDFEFDFVCRNKYFVWAGARELSAACAAIIRRVWHVYIRTICVHNYTCLVRIRTIHMLTCPRTGTHTFDTSYNTNNTLINFMRLFLFYFYLVLSFNFTFINMVKTPSNVNLCKSAIARNISTYLQTTALCRDAATIASRKFLLQVALHPHNIQPCVCLILVRPNSK